MNLNKLGSNHIIQDDGAVWTSFYDVDQNPDKHFLIITSHGKEEFLHSDVGYQGLKSLFRAYRESESIGAEGENRVFLGVGQQAVVYGLTEEYAVREVIGNPPYYQTLSDLTRLDRLASLVEGGIPRWIDVPSVYAMFSDGEINKQYTLMERIDSGLTVEDIAEFHSTTDIGRARAIQQLGSEPTQEQIETAALLFDKAKIILDSVIKSKGIDPDELLTDWAMRNVLVDITKTPVAGQRMVLNIIDQN
jgi:hypothetical protein